MKKLLILILLTIPLSFAFGEATISLDDGISGMTSNSIIEISSNDTSVWLGSGGGASVTFDGGDTWFTYDAGNGLPGEEVSALVANNRGLWVANSHSEQHSGENIPYGDGISLTFDGGQSWTTFTPKQVTFAGMLSYDMAVYDSIIYSASFYGGLVRSLDWGETWENLFPSQLDSINVDSVDYHSNYFARFTNRFFSVTVDTTALDDTLSVWAGTASGIYRFIYNSWSRNGWQKSLQTDTLNWDGFAALVDGRSTEELNVNSLISPSVNCDSATTCSLFVTEYFDGGPSGVEDYGYILLSDDGGETWPEILAVYSDSTIGEHLFPEHTVFDISAFAVGKPAVQVAFHYTKNVLDSAGVWILDDVIFKIDSLEIVNQNFEEQSWGKLGDRPPFGWTIIDSLQQDGVFNTYPDSIAHFFHNDTTVVDTMRLPGDFVVALDVNIVGLQKTVWAGCRPAFSGEMRVAYTYDDGASWIEAPVGGVETSIEVWDFAFNGDSVFVASGSGLYMSEGDYTQWTRITDFVDSEDQTFYSDLAEFFAVEYTDGTIWAGGADGVVKSKPLGWDVFRSGANSELHFAYPTPFSPHVSARGGTTIYFKPANDTYATVSIYDINLELVKTVVSGLSRIGGVESDDIIWDAKNGNGDLVANGVYFYRIELDSGEDLWGKVVVLK